jgi:hypothetical protein
VTRTRSRCQRNGHGQKMRDRSCKTRPDFDTGKLTVTNLPEQQEIVKTWEAYVNDQRSVISSSHQQRLMIVKERDNH